MNKADSWKKGTYCPLPTSYRSVEPKAISITVLFWETVDVYLGQISGPEKRSF